MERSSQSAVSFVNKLAELTNHLAAKDIVVSSLHADWSAFGSWELQAQKGEEAERYGQALLGPNPTQAIGPEVVRVCWDASPTRFCSAPNEWQEEYSNGFHKKSDELFRFVEEYLTRRLKA
jgi:hypothetical protein